MRIFILLLALLLFLALIEVGIAIQASGEVGQTLWALTRTLLVLCGLVYLYRRSPILALGALLAFLVLQAYQTGITLGGVLCPKDPSYLLAA